jgi:hypothetical protein
VRSTSRDIEAALLRIQTDYLDMPNLHLTLEEAGSLWNLEPVKCFALLELLVETGFLMRSRHGGYMRACAAAIGTTALYIGAGKPD